MSERPTKLFLYANVEEIAGSGDDVLVKISGHRTLRSGRIEHYEITLRPGRYGVTRILREVRKMHLRDRGRIEQETARIGREVAELTKEQA
ncbi:MAG: hypothetical protein ACRET2_12085 [Steroidobacteraceae bacterium]